MSRLKKWGKSFPFAPVDTSSLGSENENQQRTTQIGQWEGTSDKRFLLARVERQESIASASLPWHRSCELKIDRSTGRGGSVQHAQKKRWKRERETNCKGDFTHWKFWQRVGPMRLILEELKQLWLEKKLGEMEMFWGWNKSYKVVFTYTGAAGGWREEGRVKWNQNGMKGPRKERSVARTNWEMKAWQEYTNQNWLFTGHIERTQHEKPWLLWCGASLEAQKSWIH